MRLLLVAPSTSYRLEAFLDAAGSVGCDVMVASDAEPAIPGASIAVDFNDPAGAAERLVGLVGCVDGVVGTDGEAVVVAAETARRLGLKTNRPEALAAANDKRQQRLAAAQKSVPQPDFVVVEGSDAPRWPGLPAVIKPLRRSASQGVLRVDTPEDVADGIARVRRIVGDGQPVLVERFVPGLEVAVEGILTAGSLEVLAVFDKPDTPQGPAFPETLLVSPARLEPGSRARVVDVAGRACAAVGLVEGPVHVECKVEGSQVWFIELAARTIGGLCSRAVQSGGASLEEVVIHHALGLPDPRRGGRREATGVLMLPVASTGRLDAIRGEAAARAVGGVVDVILSVGPGQEVVALPEGDRYLGFVLARACGPDEVEAALRQAWATLEVEITAS